MPGVAPPCARPECGHPAGVHATPEGEFYKNACRVTRCECRAYQGPVEEPEPEDDPRRLVIEIPEGFIVNVQLVPVGADVMSVPRMPETWNGKPWCTVCRDYHALNAHRSV